MGFGVPGAGGPPNGSVLGPPIAPIPSSQQVPFFFRYGQRYMDVITT